MKESSFIAAAAIVLAAVVYATLKRWRFDASKGGMPMSTGGRCAIITMTFGGLLYAPFWWFDVDSSFAWDLPPVGSRLLAASGLAFGIAGLATMIWPSPRRLRLLLVMIAVGLGSIFVVTMLFHLRSFNFDRISSWVFVVATGGLAVLAGTELLRSYSGSPGLRTKRFGNPLLPLWLVLVGITMVGWSLALFLAPDTLFPAVFLWPDDARTSRLVAAMLLAVGISALLAMNDVGSGRLALLFAGVFGVGVVGAISLNSASSFSTPMLYIVAIGGIGMVSLAFLALLLASENAGNLRRPLQGSTRVDL